MRRSEVQVLPGVIALSLLWGSDLAFCILFLFEPLDNPTQRRRMQSEMPLKSRQRVSMLDARFVNPFVAKLSIIANLRMLWGSTIVFCTGDGKASVR